MKVNTIIIGAGPAGLFTAIQATRPNQKTIILEKNAVPGKKLLITGSGQCNLTQAGNIKDFLNHYGDNERFIRSSLYSFTNKNLIEFFTERGINFTTTEEGKVFPSSFKARDILDVLVKECERKNIIIKYNEPVKDVSYSNQENQFQVKTGQNKYRSNFLVLATGGQSYETTGSSGDGYLFASSLGHKINQPKPALTPIYVKNHQFSDLAGISLSAVEISLWRQGKLIKRWSGDILFTHRGISGPGILNYSRYIKPADIIKLKLIKADNEAILEKELIKKIQLNGKMLFKNLMRELPLPARLVTKLLETANIAETKKAAQVTKDERKHFAKLLFSLPLTVQRLGNFNEAMVTTGGIRLNEINSKTMESSIITNLYAVGEVLDLDGDTGGYNLQATFSTGYLAGQSIMQKNNNLL